MAKLPEWPDAPPLYVNGEPRPLYEYETRADGWQFSGESPRVTLTVTIKGWVNDADLISFQGEQFAGLVLEYRAADNIAKVLLRRIVPKGEG